MGNPPLILLDEPSTGVDPLAKRHMWSVISNISTLRKRSTVVLTTHSMEEAEALCPKMGIMVDGRFQCFGSAEHIKSKYADGFDIQLRLTDLPDTEIEALKKSDWQSEVWQSEVHDLLQTVGLLPIDFSVEKLTDALSAPFAWADLLRWASLECKR